MTLALGDFFDAGGWHGWGIKTCWKSGLVLKVAASTAGRCS